MQSLEDGNLSLRNLFEVPSKKLVSTVPSVPFEGADTEADEGEGRKPGVLV